MPKVSIIIPYYKKKKYIKRTIQSVLDQTHKNFEIILIYDDEDINDLIYLKKIYEKNKKIKFIINRQNLGAGYSRNRGIKYCKGKFVAFLDADDEWNKNKLRHQLKLMIKKNLIISHTNYKIIDKNTKKIELRSAKKINYKKLIYSCDIGLSTVMIQAKVLKKFKFPKLKTKEDFVLWLNITKKLNCDIIPINKNLTIWNKSENSLSSNSLQKIKDGFKVYNRYCNFNFIKSLFYLLILSFNFITKKKWI